jgi:hypothetical protein
MNNFAVRAETILEKKSQYGALGRITGIVIKPVETVKELIREPRILFPSLLMLLCTPLLYISRYSMYKDMQTHIFEMRFLEGNTQIPHQEMQAALKIIEISGFIAPILIILGWILLSAVLFWTMKIFNGEGTFKQYLSIRGYTYTIIALGLLAALAVSFFSGTIVLDTSQ